MYVSLGDGIFVTLNPINCYVTEGENMLKSGFSVHVPYLLNGRMDLN